MWGLNGDAAIEEGVDQAEPENMRVATISGGNGIVTHRTFLGSVTRVSVLLSGDVTVEVDVASADAAPLAPGTSVQVSLDGSAVLVTGRQAAAG